MGRRKNKRSQRNPQKAPEPQPEPDSDDSCVLYKDFYDDENDEILNISQEVHDILCKIYDEFYRDFEVRKEKRLKGNALGEVQRYNLVVQSSYQMEYQGKVRQIVQSDQTDFVYSYLQDIAKGFASRISSSLLTIKDVKARLMALSDAYHVTLNASDQVNKIASSLFRAEPKLSCEKLNQAYFYDLACEGLEGSLQWARSQEKLPSQIEKVLEMVADLSQIKYEMLCCAGPDYDLTKSLDIETESHSTEAEYIEENPIWTRTIEELVEFINPTKKPRRRNRKQKSAASTASCSPLKPADEDLEVEELKHRLAEHKPAEHRVKPNLKKSWLIHLRRQT